MVVASHCVGSVGDDTEGHRCEESFVSVSPLFFILAGAAVFNFGPRLCSSVELCGHPTHRCVAGTQLPLDSTAHDTEVSMMCPHLHFNLLFFGQKAGNPLGDSVGSGSGACPDATICKHELAPTARR